LPDFIGGIRVSELLHQNAVRPILRAAFPSLVHSAALLGPGSEVLGYGTPLSTDHDWGPRLVLLLAEDRYETLAPQLVERLGTALPRTFHGYSTHFGEPDAEGVRLRAETAGPVEHRVTVHTVRGYFTTQLGFDPVGGLTPADWLLTPQQTLLKLTAGAVYHDGLGGWSRYALTWPTIRVTYGSI
jgi:hypothetical protein